jgi:hypothetical protein
MLHSWSFSARRGPGHTTTISQHEPPGFALSLVGSAERSSEAVSEAATRQRRASGANIQIERRNKLGSDHADYSLPPWLEWLRIQDLKVSDSSVSLFLRRANDSDVATEIFGKKRLRRRRRQQMDFVKPQPRSLHSPPNPSARCVQHFKNQVNRRGG